MAADGPTIDRWGNKYWRDENGKLDRDGGPAFVGRDGTLWWYTHGKLDRDGGPALEYAGGTKEWFRKGVKHNLYGPAVDYSGDDSLWDMDNEWWVDGKKYTEEEFPAAVADFRMRTMTLNP